MKAITIKKISLLITIFAVALTSCIRERALKYDNSLLEGVTYNTDLMIAYQVPAGYKMLSQQFTDSIARVEQRENPFSEKRVAIFVDTLVGNATVCLYDTRALPYERTEDRLDFYFSSYNANGQWENIEKDVFSHGDFKKIVELDMVNTQTNRRLLKYYFYENDKAQFSIDYYLRNDFYNDLKPYVDASVASVKKDFEIVIDVLDNDAAN